MRLTHTTTGNRFGTAKAHDPKHFDALTMHEKKLVRGDSAHSSAARRTELRVRGVSDERSNEPTKRA